MKLFRRLRRGDFSVAATIDLHHMDVATATQCITDFIDHCVDRGYGCVRIIHGKGLRSPGEAKLKNLTKSMLRKHKSVLAFACAALITCGLQAQVSGSINRGAAKVTNMIEMGGNKLTVNYTALRFGQGQWQKIKDASDRHEGCLLYTSPSPRDA